MCVCWLLILYDFLCVESAQPAAHPGGAGLVAALDQHISISHLLRETVWRFFHTTAPSTGQEAPHLTRHLSKSKVQYTVHGALCPPPTRQRSIKPRTTARHWPRRHQVRLHRPSIVQLKTLATANLAYRHERTGSHRRFLNSILQKPLRVKKKWLTMR